MKRKDVDLFEKLVAQLDGFYQDLSVLVKKNQNDAVNAFKLNLINNVLRQCNELLGNKYRPFPEFEVFSLDAVPSNSDVTFIISQYIECAEKFRSDHIVQGYGNEWHWQLEEGKEVRTAPPRKIKN